MSEVGNKQKVLMLVQQAYKKLEEARLAYSLGEAGGALDAAWEPLHESLAMLTAAVEEMVSDEAATNG